MGDVPKRSGGGMVPVPARKIIIGRLEKIPLLGKPQSEIS